LLIRTARICCLTGCQINKRLRLSYVTTLILSFSFISALHSLRIRICYLIGI
jgi:hypothetical protein